MLAAALAGQGEGILEGRREQAPTGESGSKLPHSIRPKMKTARRVSPPGRSSADEEIVQGIGTTIRTP